MQEFKINEHITLKLEKDITKIYVNGEYFYQCIRLVLKIPKRDLNVFSEVNSIDDAVEVYDTYLYENRIIRGDIAEVNLEQTRLISPEEEFKAHCSNLQAWSENNYDTRLLRSNLAFPLLKELTKAGDPLAKRVFKDEIAKRFTSGNLNVITFLEVEGYLDYLSKEEFESIFNLRILGVIIKMIKSDRDRIRLCAGTILGKMGKLGLEYLSKQLLTMEENEKTLLFNDLSEIGYLFRLDNNDLKSLLEHFEDIKKKLKDLHGKKMETLEKITDNIYEINPITLAFLASLGSEAIKLLLKSLGQIVDDDDFDRECVFYIKVRFGDIIKILSKKDNILVRKELINCLINYNTSQLGELFFHRAMDLLEEEDVNLILKNSNVDLINKLERLVEMKPPILFYIPRIFQFLGEKGVYLAIKNSRDPDVQYEPDEIISFLREMGRDIINPYINEVIFNENNYHYFWKQGDIEFNNILFNNMDKKELQNLVFNSKYKILERLKQTYDESNCEILFFFCDLYHLLDKDHIIKIHTQLPETLQYEVKDLLLTHFIENYDRQQYQKDKLKILISFNDKSILIEIISFLEDLDDSKLFETLKKLLERKEVSDAGKFSKLTESIGNIYIMTSDDSIYRIGRIISKLKDIFRGVVFGSYSNTISAWIDKIIEYFEMVAIIGRAIRYELGFKSSEPLLEHNFETIFEKVVSVKNNNQIIKIETSNQAFRKKYKFTFINEHRKD